jgi:hypothetical protein
MARTAMLGDLVEQHPACRPASRRIEHVMKHPRLPFAGRQGRNGRKIGRQG